MATVKPPNSSSLAVRLAGRVAAAAVAAAPRRKSRRERERSSMEKLRELNEHAHSARGVGKRPEGNTRARGTGFPTCPTGQRYRRFDLETRVTPGPVRKPVLLLLGRLRFCGLLVVGLL